MNSIIGFGKAQRFWNLGSPKEVICNQKEENKNLRNQYCRRKFGGKSKSACALGKMSVCITNEIRQPTFCSGLAGGRQYR